MDPFLLRNLLLTVHIAAAVGVFAGLGAIIAASDERTRKLASALQGISLLLLLLVGLHLLFSQQLVKTGGWWHAKIVIWLILGAAPALVKRKVMPPGVVLAVCLLLGAVAAFLGLQKPF
jgi:hypothetical protein